MSHTLTQIQNPDQFRFVQITLVNYTVGGEAVTAAEIGATGVDAVFLATIPSTKNSLGVVLFPVLDAGKILLFRFVSGAPVELTATTTLNAIVSGVAHISSI